LPRGLISYQEFEEAAKQTGTFESVALWFPQSVNLTGVDEPQRLIGTFVSGSFFRVLSLRAERGRLFGDEESAPGTVKPVVVISHNTWQRRFNGDAGAIGATMTVNGVPLTVVGVLAPPFDVDATPGDGYFINSDLFIPAAQFPAPHGLRAAGPVMLGVAMLQPGVNVARATTDLDVILRRLVASGAQGSAAASSSFTAQGGRSLYAEPVQEAVVGTSRPALLLLFAAVGVVLLIACVNVSQLLLARAVDREKEIALRAALGASRRTVARQLTIEAALLAVASALAGLGVGRAILSSLTWLRPPSSVPIPTDLPLDATVLLFAGVITVAVALLCGLVPMLKTARPDLSRVLQAGFKRASGTGRRTRDVFMVVEMALSVALVAVSALLIQSLLAVQQAPLGFDPSNVFTLQFRLPQTKYPKPDDIARFFKASIERVRAVPGVESAALVRAVPFSGNGGTIGYVVDGHPPADPASPPQALFHLVTPDYFKTMRIPILKGRDFTERDDRQTPLVAVINDTMARRAFPNEDPIGKRFTTPQTQGPITVVGVVGDAKHYTSTEPARAQIYAAHYQVPLIFSSLVARTKGPAISVAGDVRKAIWSVDKDQPMWAVSALEDIVGRTQGQARFLAILLGIFAGIALLLAAVGIYGVTSYGVAQRTHEIGIRLALGASGDRVLREVVGRGIRLTLIASVIGLIGSIAMSRLAAAVLFGVTPTDPAALAGAAGLLALVSLAATFIPARRAARVDPVVALADE
jgi:predicted permease